MSKKTKGKIIYTLLFIFCLIIFILVLGSAFKEGLSTSPSTTTSQSPLPCTTMSVIPNGARSVTFNNKFPNRCVWSKDSTSNNSGSCSGNGYTGFLTVPGTECTNICATNLNNGTQCITLANLTSLLSTQTTAS